MNLNQTTISIETHHFITLPLGIWNIIKIQLYPHELVVLSFVCQFFKFLVGHAASLFPRSYPNTKWKTNFIHLLSKTTSSLPLIKFSLDIACPLDTEVFSSASLIGSMPILEFLKENGCPWDEWTCCNAAAGGHLEVLKWARENGCPWDEWTCYNAAAGGYLDMLKWARENGATIF